MDSGRDNIKRISVSFYEETAEKLLQRMSSKGLKSIAQCVRELVELGLKIEEAASKKTDEIEEEKEEIVLLNDIKNLLKNSLDWTMESRLLIRLLVENVPDLDKKKAAEILEIYKEKAKAHVKGLLNEDVI